MPASAARFGPSTIPARQALRTPMAAGGRPRADSQRTGGSGPRRPLALLAAVTTCLALVLTVLVTGPGAVVVAAASPTDVAAHYVTLSGSPGMPELDPGNGTIYVPIQCPQAYCPTNAPGRAVDIVNAATCNATNGSGCHVVATAPADGPLGAAIDPTTGTVYVMNNPPTGDSTIGLLDGRTCNGTVTSGCRRVVATIAIGANAFIVAGAVDAATRTLYVASPTHGVYVVDIANCNDLVTTGCGQHAVLVKDDRGPGQLDIDPATNTIYVADQGNPNLETSNASTVTVIDGDTCDASNQSGCGAAPATVTVAIGVSAVAVDRANNTVYVAKSDGVSLIDGARCSSLTVSGCHNATHSVVTGAGTGSVVVDAQDHTVFALNGSDDTLSSIDAATCDGATPSACPALAPSQREAPEVGPGANQNDLIVTPGNQTAYAVNEGGPNVLIVTGVGGCTALDHRGCRVLAPSVPDAGALATLDPATGTLYVTDENLPQVDVIDASRCDPARLSGCVPVGKIPTDGPNQVGFCRRRHAHSLCRRGGSQLGGGDRHRDLQCHRCIGMRVPPCKHPRRRAVTLCAAARRWYRVALRALRRYGRQGRSGRHPNLQCPTDLGLRRASRHDRRPRGHLLASARPRDRHRLRRGLWQPVRVGERCHRH